MTDMYSARVDLSSGVLELSGPDKDWMAQQLSELAPLLRELFASDPDPAGAEDSPEPKSEKAEETEKAPATKGKAKNGGRKATARAKRNDELVAKLTPETCDKLLAYMEARSKAWNEKQSNKAAIIAKFLEEELDTQGIDATDLYTVMSVMGWKSPGNPRSTLKNAQQRDSYFSAEVGGRFQLSYTGENFAVSDSLNSDDEPDT